MDDTLKPGWVRLDAWHVQAPDGDIFCYTPGLGWVVV